MHQCYLEQMWQNNLPSCSANANEQVQVSNAINELVDPNEQV